MKPATGRAAAARGGAGANNGLAALRREAVARWRALQPRERRLAMLAALVLVAALLWLVAIRPAWTTFRSYAASHQALEQQVQQMQAMRQRALQLQQQLAASAALSGNPATLVGEIQAGVRRLLGSQAQATAVGDRVTVRFENVPVPQLLQWLQEVRDSTRGQPAQVQLTRSAEAGEGVPPHWSGQVVLVLPLASQP